MFDSYSFRLSELLELAKREPEFVLAIMRDEVGVALSSIRRNNADFERVIIPAILDAEFPERKTRNRVADYFKRRSQ